MAVDWNTLVIGPTVNLFGDQVQYAPASGAPAFTVTGVFDEAYLQLMPLGRGGADIESFDLGSPGAITTEMPVLGVQVSQFAYQPQQNDRLVVLTGLHAGERYQVKEARPDGHGHAKLMLNALLG